MHVGDISNEKCCYVQLKKAVGGAAGVKHKGGQAGSKGHTLDIVTFTAKLSSENKSLR